MFRSMTTRIGTALVAVSALAGCVTNVYGPISERSQFGYADTRNADGSYTVRVVAASPVQAHEYWDRRAAELCGSTTFRKNIFRAEIPVVTTSGYAVNAYNPAYGSSYQQDVYGALIMEGYLHCEAAAAEPTAAPAETVVDPPPAAAPTQP